MLRGEADAWEEEKEKTWGSWQRRRRVQGEVAGVVRAVLKLGNEGGGQVVLGSSGRGAERDRARAALTLGGCGDLNTDVVGGSLRTPAWTSLRNHLLVSTCAPPEGPFRLARGQC